MADQKGSAPVAVRKDSKNSKNNEEQEVADSSNTKKPSNKFSCTQRISLTVLALVDFMGFCSMSIMAPFYPAEASKKGMSESTAGFVFGFYALVMFISSPVYGKIMPKLGINCVFTIGIIVSGTCNILFGTLQYIDDYNLFTTLSFLIRGAEALGCSAYSNAGYVLILDIFPNDGGYVRGLLETFVGLGMSVGPAIGGCLYTIGGFGLPFYVLGLFILFIAYLTAYFLPKTKQIPLEEQRESMIKLLKLPLVLISFFIIVVVSITWSFLDPTLEPHLRKFELSPGTIGLIFLLLSTMYGIFSPAFGWLTDNLTPYWWLMSIGMLFNAISLLFLGPSSLVTFADGLWLNIAALSFLGIFVAMGLMPTYQSILDGALNSGMKDSMVTHSLVSGVWSSAYSLGEVIGPVIGGVVLEHWDFPVLTSVIALINLFMSLITFLYFLTKKKRNLNCDIEGGVSKDKEFFKSNSEFSVVIKNTVPSEQ